jgi:RHS repeat-associated protein
VHLDGGTKTVTCCTYTNKDRLLSEELTVDGNPTSSTTYAWNGPEQVGKTVTEGGVTTSQTQMEYDVTGRLSKVTITTYTSGQASSIVTQEFTYDADGIKVTQTETVDSDADGVVDSSKSTEYLNDKQNHTGYSQVLEERFNDGSQTRTTTYTIGHDVIAQFSAAVGALVLLTDAHGSTRAVADAAAQVQQEYLYDAYGTLLNMQPANALTSLLYSGEQFNPVAGLQYLRARWYDPSIGRFTRMDPYSGNVQDPLGLHKYTYANGNPVMAYDPTGLESLCEVMVNMAVQSCLGNMLAGPAIRAVTGGVVAGALLGAMLPVIWPGAYDSFSAMLVGASLHAGGGGYGAQLGVTAGGDLLISDSWVAAYLHSGVDLSAASGSYSLGADTSFGWVFQCDSPAEYSGWFERISIPMSFLHSCPALRKWVEEGIGDFALALTSGALGARIGTVLAGTKYVNPNYAKQLSVFKKATTWLSGRINNINVLDNAMFTAFIDLSDRRPFGFSINPGIQFAPKQAKSYISIGLSYYYQI